MCANLGKSYSLIMQVFANPYDETLMRHRYSKSVY